MAKRSISRHSDTPGRGNPEAAKGGSKPHKSGAKPHKSGSKQGARVGKRRSEPAARGAAKSTSRSTSRSEKRADRPDKARALTWVAASLPGLEDLLAMELERRFRGQVSFLEHARTSECHFRFTGTTEELLAIRLCHTLHQRRDFDVLRPRTLLSPEHLNALARDLVAVMALRPEDRYEGLRLEAAGANSPTMQRLGTQLADKLGMPFHNDTGDLVVTLRPGKKGWEVLYRVGNRPLGTRAWRQVDYLGSLNGTVAAALVEMSAPSPQDRFLNLMCGSGTIMIERRQRSAATVLVGVDNSVTALDAARQNCAAAGVRTQVQLLQGDVRRLPFADASFDKLCADLPWGESIGSKKSNTSLYRDTFDEAYRLCRLGGKLVGLTQDQGSLQALGPSVEGGWHLLAERTFVQRGFHPRCRVYQKRG